MNMSCLFCGWNLILLSSFSHNWFYYLTGIINCSNIKRYMCSTIHSFCTCTPAFSEPLYSCYFGNSPNPLCLTDKTLMKCYCSSCLSFSLPCGLLSRSLSYNFCLKIHSCNMPQLFHREIKCTLYLLMPDSTAHL